MKEIPLTQGKVALVDDGDYEWLSAHKWQARRDSSSRWYAVTSRYENGKTRSTQMHRLLLDAPEVDHKDRDSLNNQRHNLRSCTRSQNSANSAPRKNKRFKGTMFHKASGRFAASIHHKKDYWLGTYETEEEAARAYDAKAKELFGGFAYLNFPDEAAQ